MMKNYQSYIICTTPRSGSTLLCKLLSATGKSGNPDSWLHTPSVTSWLNLYLHSSLENFSTKREALDALFQAVRQHGACDTGIFGLRLQRERADFLMQQLAILHPEITSNFGRIEAVFGKTLFIYLNRSDKLEQAISYVKATQTGLWHVAPDGTEIERLSPPKEAVYDADQILNCLEKAVSENLEWEQWFESEGIKTLRISYEGLASSPEHILTRIFDALGLKLDSTYKAEPAVGKLADKTSQQWKERYLLKAH